MATETHQEPENPPKIERRKAGFFSKIGGGALTFAIIFHVILLVIGAFWVFQITREPEKKVDFMPSGGGGGERAAESVSVKKRAQITPTTNVKRVFAEGATASYALPEQSDNFGEMSSLSSLSGGGMSGGLGGSGSGKGFGKGAGNGSGMGMGAGAGKLFGLVPENMRKRCSKEDRLQRLKDNGGTPGCEDAVVKGLRWLKANQNPDGSWGEKKAAMTGLALLAYFGHCETPVSPEFGESCMKGIIYLVNLGMANDGKMAITFADDHWCYEHAIATYALGEAYTFCKDLKVDVPGLPEMTGKAGQFIIDNQHESGGWAYAYLKEKGHPDVSIAGWHIQALKACAHTDIKYRSMSKTITSALQYVNDRQAPSGGYGYTDMNGNGNLNYLTLTGVGMLCNQMWDKGGRSEVSKAAKYVRENTRFEYNGEFSDLYGHYYESQAMMQRGGEDWMAYNDMFRDQLLNNQEADGSWKVPGGGKKIRAVGAQFLKDKVYRTCLCTLMLEVYYRFLSTGGGGSGSGGGRPRI